MSKLEHYAVVSELFKYPGISYVKKVSDARRLLLKERPGAGAQMDRFLSLLPIGNLNSIREIYARSFDVQSLTALDVGYVLFGDDYKRGEFLVNLGREHKSADVNCGLELADHLSNVLMLISRLKDKEFLLEFVSSIVFPAVKKMIDEFEPKKIKQKNNFYARHYKSLIDVNENRFTMYKHCLSAIRDILVFDFSLAASLDNFDLKSDFLKTVNQEARLDGVF